ncbi:MAG TPA: AarF/UbiB family protein [Gemmatimonadaceae bacterium]|jgi:predicted unusual protein kinase regulating ubiquinone biosynthesis (AarF/ABC1/UbiB family)|nr:AarF/UbiB family protein [Gemmatimonadaceae bacterium]
MLLAPRNLSRLSATVGLFSRYGLADFARQQGLHGLANQPDDVGVGVDASPERAKAFRRRLVELGPAYIKLGQALSTRPDLLPPPYIAELEQLQDDVPPVPFDDIRDIVEHELQGRLSKLFMSFDPHPLGSASLGQAHAASLRDGRSVVVKVQRPGLREQLGGDIAFFRELADFLEDHTNAGARVDLAGIIQQLERALADELDYRIEARNAATFRHSLAEFPRILVPRVIEAYSTSCVLTTERVRGTKVSDISPLVRLEHDFAPVAADLTRAYLKQITLDGHFHADPHPGNVFVLLPESDNPATPSEIRATDRRREKRQPVTPLSRIERQAQDDAAPTPRDLDVRLALIDFGMTARLSTGMREQVVRLLMDMTENRGEDAADALTEIGDELPSFDRTRFVNQIASLITRDFDSTIGAIDTGSLLYDLINISFREGLRLPSELTLLAKAMVNLDAVTRAIDPTFSPIQTIRDYGKQLAAERARRDISPRRLAELAIQGSELAMALPHRIDLITSRLASNEFQTTVEVPQLTSLIEAMQKVANRVFSGLVLAGVLVASAMVLPNRRILGTAGFLLAGIIGVWMVLAIVWSDRKPPGQ